MKNVWLVLCLVLLSPVALAGKPCPPGHQNISSCAGEPFPDGYGGDFDIDNSSNAVGVGVGVASSESNSKANATGGSAVSSASGGSATVGDVTNNNTVTAAGGAGGAGGEGGSAVAAAVVETGAVQVEEGAISTTVSYEYRQVRQAPSIGQGSFAISGCGVAGNAGGSNQHGAVFLGIGWTPRECYKFMLAQAYQSVGEKKAVCDILKNTKVGKRLERDGIELPECVEEVVIIEVPVPAEVDLSPYATKEALNRAFERSQQK